MGLSAATALVAATGAVSSFAWFAANSTVTATGMTIIANASDAYLQIGNSAEDFADTSKSYNSAAATTASATITPVQAYKSIDSSTHTGTAYDGGTVAWGTGNSDYVDSAGVNDSGISSIGEVTADYALFNDFKLRLRPATNGTTPTAKSLSISVSWADTTNWSNDKLHNSVSVLVTNSTYSKGQLFTNNGETFTATAGTSAVKVVESLKDTVQAVRVYVFFNGDDENCKSSNVITDKKYSVKLSFSIDQN